ncbi:MAG: hypothetical protein M3414_07130, partial [Pseudomonadota bacterium]|nr:hypothetical protein [Pseudomonadota bacterium]
MRFIRNASTILPSASPGLRARGRLILLAVALAAAAAPAAAIEPFTADYQANYMGMKGQGQMKLVADGAGRWRYTLDISNQLAKLKQSTVFEEHNGGWRPLSGD